MIIRFVLFMCLSCCSLPCQDSRPSLWRDSLSWYMVWMTAQTGGGESIQCEGQVRTKQAVQFRCGEETLVMDMGFDSSRGGCFVQFMRKAFSDEANQFSKN